MLYSLDLIKLIILCATFFVVLIILKKVGKMKKSRYILFLVALGGFGFNTANAEDVIHTDITHADDSAGWDFHIGVSAKVGTLGYGLEVSVPVIEDKLNVRAGFNTFNYDYEEESESSTGATELTYKGDLSLQSLPLLIDWHPFSGGFRLSAGLVFNSNEIIATAECAVANCEFGDLVFDAATLGTTKLSVDLGGTQPYLGLGFGNAVSSDGRLSFVFDLGVVFQDVAVKLTTSDACQANTICRDEAEREEAELQDDVKDFDMYPVLAFGLSYKFR